MIGLGLSIPQVAGRGGGGLSGYSVAGIAPSLVLDFVTQTYAVDPGGWAEVYAVGGQRPSLVLDFVNQEYGA